MLEHYSLRDTSFYKSVQFASVLAGNIKKMSKRSCLLLFGHCKKL